MRRKAIKPKGWKRSKSIEAIEEPRPSVRVVASANLSANEQKIFRGFARRVLAKLKENIRTNMGGRWQKVQHDYQGGPNTGDLALQGTEDQWVVEVLSSRTIKIRPKRQYMKRWRGHIHGMTIKAKRGGPAMPIPFADGTKLLRKVVLPKRDPRPTVSQMVQLSKER